MRGANQATMQNGPRKDGICGALFTEIFNRNSFPTQQFLNKPSKIPFLPEISHPRRVATRNERRENSSRRNKATKIGEVKRRDWRPLLCRFSLCNQNQWTNLVHVEKSHRDEMRNHFVFCTAIVLPQNPSYELWCTL